MNIWPSPFSVLSLMADKETDGVKSHPLADTWTLWIIVLEQGTGQFGVSELCSFSTVEEFWVLMERVGPISNLKSGGLALFKKQKDGIKPAWEDKRNVSFYGIWHLPGKDDQRAQWNSYWEKILMLLIGGTIDRHISVPVSGCYAQIKSRSGNLSLELWFGEGDVNMNSLAECLDVKPVTIHRISPKNSR
jgi:hypothetical protein